MRTVDLTEAAKILHMHPHTLEVKARNGEIPGAKPGKCWVFVEVDLIDWLRAQYRNKQAGNEICHSSSAVTSIGVNGLSAAKKLEKLLAQPTKPKRKNTTTAAVLNFGAPQS